MNGYIELEWKSGMKDKQSPEKFYKLKNITLTVDGLDDYDVRLKKTPCNNFLQVQKLGSTQCA